MRTRRNLVAFAREFTLPGMNGSRPAGSYVVDTDEEQIGVFSSSSYRRIATFIHVPMIEHGAASIEVIQVNADELAMAMKGHSRLATVEGDPS